MVNIIWVDYKQSMYYAMYKQSIQCCSIIMWFGVKLTFVFLLTVLKFVTIWPSWICSPWKVWEIWEASPWISKAICWQYIHYSCLQDVLITAVRVTRTSLWLLCHFFVLTTVWCHLSHVSYSWQHGIYLLNTKVCHYKYSLLRRKWA